MPQLASREAERALSPMALDPTSLDSTGVNSASSAALRGQNYASGASQTSPRTSAEPGVLSTLKQEFGNLLGENMQDVPVALDSARASSAQARGVMEGGAVHLAIPAGALSTEDGRELLAHELVHVAQARRGAGEQEESAEKQEMEADKLAEQLAAGKSSRAEVGTNGSQPLYKKASAGLTQAQVASAIAYNRARYGTSMAIAIQQRVGAAADGVIGPKTVQAIANWQRARGLSPDGKVGPMTLSAMGLGASDGASKPKPSTTPAPSSGGSLSAKQVQAAIQYNKARGFSHAQRVQIQQTVGTVADGDIGPKSVQAIAKWQASRGMTADGKVGPATSSAMGIKPASGGGGAGTPGISINSSNSAKLSYAKQKAVQMGLVITSTTGGKHAPNSYHYIGRAVDVSGSPSIMAAFYKHMKQLKPTELFYDPLGGMKNGVEIGAIGGHGNHVHVAF